MTYDQWKTTEPEEEPIWKQKGYSSRYEYFEAIELGIDDMEEDKNE